MQLTKEQLEEFKRLYEEQAGCSISREKAMSEALDLLELVKTIYAPVPPKDLYEISQEILSEI